MEKTRDLVKKNRNTKGTFYAKMGTIKDRNGMDMTETEDIKKRWQEYKEELYKKDLHDPDNHDGVITHLEPDILECEVKWALESFTMNKASGGDGIPSELLQLQKADAVKVLHSICQQIWKTQQWPQDWKRSVFIPIPEKGNAKECSNYRTIALISHASKVMLKIFQASLQQYLNHELPDVQAGFRKVKVKVTQSCPALCDPMDYAVHGIFQARILEWVAFPFSRGIFPTQGLNPVLPYCRWILYQLSHKGSPRILEWVAYPFSSRFSQPRNQTRASCIAGSFFTN